MENELFGHKDLTIDEMREEFEKYKLRSAQLDERLGSLCLKEELQELRADMQQLRQDMEFLQDKQTDMSGWHDLNAIETLDSRQIEGDQLEEQKPQLEKQKPTEGKLVVSCGSSACLFEHCRRRVDSQLLLLHYLCDHNDETATSQRCHKLTEGQRVVLSFHTRNCHFKQNHVLGLLAYAGELIQQQHQESLPSGRREIYNSFLPQEHAHLASDLLVVVLICKTAANAALKDKRLARRALAHASPTDQVFVIWLATPHNRRQLNATMNLCGRDAAVQASSIVAVRQVRQSQDTCRFMPVDANYWRISFNEMQKLTNNFRDEVHLEIALTELNDRFSV